MMGGAQTGNLAWIAFCLLFANQTGVADTVNARLRTAVDEPDSPTTAQAEYSRLMALARGQREAVSEQKGRIDVSGLPALGAQDAALAIVEFSSYQCGYCRRHFSETMPFLKAQYIDNGRLRYVFRDLALDSGRQHAVGAAEAAYCADEQSGYQAFRGRLFRSGTDLSPDALRRHARSVGLNLVRFQACIDSGRHRAKSAIDPKIRRQFQIRGTPTFIIGFLDRHDGKVIALRRISGARPLDLFKRQLEELEPVTLRMSLYQGPAPDLEDR
jgi:protein-disulfide isomerase